MKRGVKKTLATLGAIRIIGGQWRGRKLPVLDAEGLRPTTDRNKETLFNWLMPHIQDRRGLDVFAGSGGLGFEALSRHALSMTFIELDRAATKLLEQNALTLQLNPQQVKIIQGDSLKILALQGGEYDLIFLDPPFHQSLLPKVIKLIDDKMLLAKNGLIYIESEAQGAIYQVPQDWRCIKEKAGKQVCFRLYQKSNAN
jgi:16S rRNA (guanine966-N2)-methyltransferase